MKYGSRLFINDIWISTTKDSKNRSDKSTHDSTLSKYTENKMDMTKFTEQHDLIAIEHENFNRDLIEKYQCKLNNVTNLRVNHPQQVIFVIHLASSNKYRGFFQFPYEWRWINKNCSGYNKE